MIFSLSYIISIIPIGFVRYMTCNRTVPEATPPYTMPPNTPLLVVGDSCRGFAGFYRETGSVLWFPVLHTVIYHVQTLDTLYWPTALFQHDFFSWKNVVLIDDFIQQKRFWNSVVFSWAFCWFDVFYQLIVQLPTSMVICSIYAIIL